MRVVQRGGDLDLEAVSVGADAAGQLGCEDLDHDCRRSARSEARNTRDMPPPPSSRSMAYALFSAVSSSC